MANNDSLRAARQDLTLTGRPLDGEAVSIAGRLYVFRDQLADVRPPETAEGATAEEIAEARAVHEAALAMCEGDVQIGATLTETLGNLAAAINGSSGAGTAYAPTTRNAAVRAGKPKGSTLGVSAGIAGEAGNHVPVGAALSGGSWAGPTLAGGSGNALAALEDIFATSEMGSEVRSKLGALAPHA